MKNIKLINSPYTQEQRIQARIESFRKDLIRGEGDMHYINDILDVVFNYLAEYEDDDIHASTIKIKEAIFYIDNFNSY
jgi:pullulanase/glycogen debranching enzyme